MVSNTMKEALKRLEESVKKIEPMPTQSELLREELKKIKEKFPEKINRNKKRP